MPGYKKNQRRFDDKPKSGSAADLIRSLHSVDGSSYGAYKRVLGQWTYDNFTVHIDRIQADPYAPPSAVRVTTTATNIGLAEAALTSADRRVAAADFLVRNLGQILYSNRQFSALSIAGTGQEILERSAAKIFEQGNELMVELRMQVRMPARGRTILGHHAATIFEHDLPGAFEKLFAFPTDRNYFGQLISHLETYEDHQALSEILLANNWVSFVADGAILARKSGISQLPLLDAVPFTSPNTLSVNINLPHAGTISGMALPQGITVIVGGGYHGKSTILSAIQRGVYAHIPGDGRELVATLPRAMKVRAADGRPITKVDVSPFINHLPTGSDTARFSTQNASGSTSQAATIIESVQAGSELLLIDEDTSATNLMIRDERMRALVTEGQEPITPLVDRIRGMCSDFDLSMILVMGGSGAYLDVADRVLQMDAYHCLDVTKKAQKIAAELPRERTDLPGFPQLLSRKPRMAAGGSDRPKTRSNGLDSISLDKDNIDVADVEQIVDPGQTEAIAWCLREILQNLADSKLTMPEIVQILEEQFNQSGLDSLSRYGARKFPAFLVRPRAIDVVAALNRYRKLTIS